MRAGSLLRGLARVAIVVLGAAASMAPARASAQGLDWDISEEPAGPALTALRNVRDGTLGLLEDALDLQLGLFAETALLASTLTMAASDGVGLIDDNPVSQYVLRGIASQSLAKTAYLLHVAGAEALLGGHGLETEWALEQAMTELNPLLQDEPPTARLPLDPLAFAAEGLIHTEVYLSRIPGRVGLAAVLADAVVRPAGNLLRLVSAIEPADRLEGLGTAWVREAAE